MFTPTFFAELDVKSLDILLECLVRLDLHYLYQHPDTPSIFDAGVRYAKEPIGSEEWLIIPEVIRRGVGDCEDLACWLAAEYRARGIMAQAFATRVPTRNPRPLFHVRVRTGGGTIILDPSAEMGMVTKG